MRLWRHANTSRQDFDSEVMKKMKLVDAGPEGYVQFELTIGNEFSNLNDVMHGGAAGVIFGMLFPPLVPR